MKTSLNRVEDYIEDKRQLDPAIRAAQFEVEQSNRQFERALDNLKGVIGIGAGQVQDVAPAICALPLGVHAPQEPLVVPVEHALDPGGLDDVDPNFVGRSRLIIQR